MNSINIGAASAGSNLVLFKNNRGLSSSRQSVARSTYSASSINMAAAIVAGNQGKTPGDSADDHHLQRQQIKVNDPVELRTCTVDEAFRRMEELVGSEEEEKNWKGIVIALLVIAFILGMIALAIVLITPAPDVYDPGDPLPFSVLTDKNLQIKRPAFNWVRGTDQYVHFVQQETNTTDKFVERYATVVNPSANNSEYLLVPQAVISSEMRGAEAVTASSNTNYALVQIELESNSITSVATYRIYDRHKSRVMDLSQKKLQHAMWIGNESELVYIQDNDIYYKKSAEHEEKRVTTDGSTLILNGVADKTHKVYIFPLMESLIWPSPVDGKFLFARIDRSDVKTTKTTSSVRNDAGFVTLYIVDGETPHKLNLPTKHGYLTAVTWMDVDRVLVVWLSLDHQMEQYIICSYGSKDCHVNYEYTSATDGLHWVGLYGTPIYNDKKKEYYTLLPDPANENRFYRHVAALKVNKSERRDPEVTFLTSHSWSDVEILGLQNSLLFFLSTGSNFTRQHLYSVDVESKEVTCISCSMVMEGMDEKATYVDAAFSYTYDYVYLSVLGPYIPTFLVIDLQSLNSEEIIYTQIAKRHHEVLTTAYENIYLPKVEFLTVPLDYGAEASVKLILPSIFNREKSCLYEMIIIVNSVPGSRIATHQFALGFQEYLAKNQTYIIALADVRGAGGRGEKLHQSIFGALGVAEARDIGNVTSFLIEHADSYKVDAAYTAVLGKDYGGFISLHAATNASLKCAIASAPIYSLTKYGGWLYDRYMHNSTSVTDLNYDCVDTTASCYLPKASDVLLVHGTDDAVVAVDNSMDLTRQLQIAGYPFRQQMYPAVGNSLETSDVAPHYYHTIINYLSECFEVKQRRDESQIDFCANR